MISYAKPSGNWFIPSETRCQAICAVLETLSFGSSLRVEMKQVARQDVARQVRV